MNTKHSTDTPYNSSAYSRRDMLLKSGTGFGALALASLLNAEKSKFKTKNPLAPKPSPLKARAKSVIFLFMEGGPSHIDLFDPKPLLNQLAGKQLPESFGTVITPMGEGRSPLLGSKRKWKQHGQCGHWISDWLPHTATCADDITVIRSCWQDGINHSGSVCQMNTGSVIGGRPSLGSWAIYGLGSENQNLPSFVIMEDNPGRVNNGPRNWSSGFLPAVYQGTAFKGGNAPIAHLNNPKGVNKKRQLEKRDLLLELNRQHAKKREIQTELEARIQSYELAFNMQAQAPEAMDLSSESEDTRELYGMHKKETATFGRNCLLARRLVERGVRFVQLYHGAGSKWDAHSGIENNHTSMCKSSDLPVAGLLKDLKRRGLLDETLVIWGGEFGRTPMSEKGNGRDHNPTGFTMWMAGGGVRPGQVIGKTDDLGLRAIEDPLHVLDLHATILYALGLDPQALTFLHKGRPERPTINTGEPFLPLFA